jgi:hypothetical protein
MTATMTAHGAVVCPTWCDNATSGQPHHADAFVGDVLHRTVVDRGSDWIVYVYAADEVPCGQAEAVVYADGGPDFEQHDELVQYIAALTQAAAVAAAAGMAGVEVHRA